jgi:hypothetical protein
MKTIATIMTSAALLLAVSDARAIATCRDLLAGNAYDCTALNENDSAFPVCITTNAAPSDEVAMTFDPGAESWTGTCSCDAKGSASKPKWDQAKTFLCALDSASLGSFAASGRATGSGITNGRFTLSNGFSSRFTCTKRTSPCP